MAAKPNATGAESEAIRERNVSGATTITLAEYQALSPSQLKGMLRREYADDEDAPHLPRVHEPVRAKRPWEA